MGAEHGERQMAALPSCSTVVWVSTTALVMITGRALFMLFARCQCGDTRCMSEQETALGLAPRNGGHVALCQQLRNLDQGLEPDSSLGPKPRRGQTQGAQGGRRLTLKLGRGEFNFQGRTGGWITVVHSTPSMEGKPRVHSWCITYDRRCRLQQAKGDRTVHESAQGKRVFLFGELVLVRWSGPCENDCWT